MSERPLSVKSESQAPVGTCSKQTAANEIADRNLDASYQRLRNLAHTLMRNEAPGHTLQATALVHEAYLKLIKSFPVDDVQDSDHFQALVIRAMRQVLVDHARSRNADKRNGRFKQVELHDAIGMANESPEAFLLIDEVISRLRSQDSLKARVFEMRFILGFSRAEVAEALGLSIEQVKNAQEFVSAWIRRELKVARGDK